MTCNRTIIIGGNMIAIAELFFQMNFSTNTSNFVAGQKENNTNTQQTHTKPHAYSSFTAAVAAMSGADGG